MRTEASGGQDLRLADDQLADEVTTTLLRNARVLARGDKGDREKGALFINVAATIQRERARIAAGLPFEIERPERPAPVPPPSLPPQPVEQMQVRERGLDVIRCLAQGMSAAEAAKELTVSVDTVKSEQKRAAKAMGVRNTAGALVSEAYLLGLLGSG